VTGSLPDEAFVDGADLLGLLAVRMSLNGG
jgi:hypothetical protein